MRHLLVKNPQIEEECEIDILALQAPRPTYEQDVYVIGGSSVMDSNVTTVTSTSGSYSNSENKSIRSGSLTSNVVSLLDWEI